MTYDAIQFLGINGSLPGWITAGGVVGILAVVLRFFPDWTRAKASERVSDSEISKKLRDELFAKLQECEERHEELKNDYEVLFGAFQNQEQRVQLLEEGDRRKMTAITLLMNEVSRLDPTSDIIIRAKAVLELSMSLIPMPENLRRPMSKLGDEE